MKSGFVAILGHPNVGKSTILNGIINRKISIVTDKSQTTRNIIKGIYRGKDSQIIFIDTPGIHKPHVKLGVEMNSMAYSSAHEADVNILVVDASKPYSDSDDLEELIALVEKLLPEGPEYYPGEEVTDKDEVFQIKEIIREKVLKTLREEVPHSIAIYVDHIEWEENPLHIHASIIVEKDSQKGIVIGANGKRIKEIGLKARRDIERLLNKHVYLELFVKVQNDWRDNDDLLELYGYKNKKQ